MSKLFVYTSAKVVLCKQAHYFFLQLLHTQIIKEHVA